MIQGICEYRLREALHVAGLDLLVCRLPEHVLLLCGYWPMNGMSFAFFPTAGDPVLIVPEGERRWVESGRWSDVRAFSWGAVCSPAPLESVAGHTAGIGLNYAAPTTACVTSSVGACAVPWSSA